MRTAISIATFFALAVAAVPAKAENIVFRYKTGISLNASDGYGTGNDITVDFTGALGYPFSKVIPVSTRDVALWMLDTGQFQPGLKLDPSTGIISGVATGGAAARQATLIGYDASGRGIARARITFRFKDPVGTPQTFVAYGHTAKYLYKTIPATRQVASWDSLTMLPDDFKTSGLALSGTPEQPYEQGLAFRGYDYMGKEVAFAAGDLLVQDGPTFDEIVDQLRRPENIFTVEPHVKHAVGILRYTLIAHDGKPSSLGFDAETGLLRGTIPTFSTKLRFQIRAVDQDGTTGVSNIFTLTTADPDVDISALRSLHAVVGTPYSRKLTGKDIDGTMDWEVIGGQLPEGLDLDHDTGVISGTPAKEETQALAISVSTSSGGYGETGTFQFVVRPEAFDVSFAGKDVRVGQSFTTDGPTVGTTATAPWAFSLASGASVKEGLSVDEAAAKVSGAANEPGDASVAFNFINGDGHEKVVTQRIAAYNPLSVAYDDVITLHRRSFESSLPTIAEQSVIGSGFFEVTSGSLPPGLHLLQDSGRIEGIATRAGTWPGIVVTMKDSSGASVNSNTFSIEIADRPSVEVSIEGTSVERYVGNAFRLASAENAYDGVKFELSAGTLPSGLSLSSDGVLSGSTDIPEGTYDGFRVKATDGEGYVGESSTFSIAVISPQALSDLAEGDMSKSWTEGVPFSFTVPRPDNAYGAMLVSITGAPAGVTASGPTVSGTIVSAGSYPMSVSMVDDTGRVLNATFRLNILEPMTVEFAGSGQARSTVAARSTANAVKPAHFDLPGGSQAEIAPTVTNGIEPVSFAFSGTIPTGMTFAAGSIDGIPSAYGETATSTVTVSDAAGTSVSIPVTMNVIDRLPIDVSYNLSAPMAYVNTFMTGRAPTTVNAIGPVEYQVQGVLPKGVAVNPKTGVITGRPTQDGRFKDIIVTATDSEGAAYAGSTDPFEMGISRLGNVGLAARTVYTVRAGAPFLRVLKPTNVTKPLTFREASGGSMPHGLNLNPSDGTISGTLASEGTYSANVTVTDDFGRSKSTVVQIIAVKPLAIAPPSVLTMNQWGAMTKQVTATNVIGSRYYSLTAGTLPDGLSLNTSTGSIVGIAEKKGTWPGIVISVTDSTGASALTSPFALTVTDRLPLTLNMSTSYPVFVNLKYKMTLPVQNAIGGVTYVQTGTLPPGIAFDAAKGEFSGTATSLGTFPGISVAATDGKGATVTKTFSMVVTLNNNPITLTVTNFITKVGNAVATKAPTWSNNVGNTTIWGDALLAENGLTIDPATGIITGQATELMDITPNVHITDPTDRVTSKPIRIQVIPDTVINAPEVVNLTVNTSMTVVTATASNTIGTAAWSMTGTLPTGVTFAAATGRLSGTPTEMGSFNIVITNTDSTGDAQSKTITVNVANNGTPPTIALVPTATGYVATTSATITPTYTNKKVGDVVSLAPGSADLPPGMTIVKNASGVWVINKAVATAADVGVYRGITLRVTDTDGLYSETGPMDIIYRPAANLAYPAVTWAGRANEPISFGAPVPSAGQAIEDVAFEFSSKAAGGQNLTVDPATGAIKGYVTASGTNVVKVTESYDGKTIRTFTYNVAFTVNALSMTMDNVGLFVDNAYVSRKPVVTNGLQGQFSVVGNLPMGLSLDSADGSFKGTAAEIGTFNVTLTFTDQFGAASLPVVINVHGLQETGHKYWKIVWVGGGARGTWLYELDYFDRQGANMMEAATVTGDASIHDQNPATGKFSVVSEQAVFEFPGAVDLKEAVAVVEGDKWISNPFFHYYYSDDGISWTLIKTDSWPYNWATTRKITF